MLIQVFAFYLFSGVLLLSALMVITVRNPVHSVLFLILSFFNAAGLFVLLGAEFIGMLLVIVYVGAVAVLFLFVVMMLDINFADLRKGAMQYLGIGILVGGALLAEMVFLYTSWDQATVSTALSMSEVSNTQAIGQVLYTDYVFAFQIAGLILFVAMIGAIVLTHRKRPGVRRQDIAKQHATKQADVLEMRKVTPRTGA